VNSSRPHRPQPPSCEFAIRISIFIFLLTAGCGAPGEPTPPSPPIPATIGDLSARQAGDGALLTFTLPTKTVSGDRLSSPPAGEILRGVVKADGTVDAKTFRVVYTLPGALSDNFASKGVIQFTDPISPEETKLHPGAPVAYRVRTRASQKRASADSTPSLYAFFPLQSASPLSRLVSPNPQLSSRGSLRRISPQAILSLPSLATASIAAKSIRQPPPEQRMI